MRSKKMTYKLNPAIKKIVSPVVIVFEDGHRREFSDGKSAASAIFDKHYIVTCIKAINDVVELTITENKGPEINWIGEENISFF